MPKLPDYIGKGEPITAAWLNSLVDYIRSITPSGSSGGKVLTKRSSSGTTFSVQQTQQNSNRVFSEKPRWELTGFIDSGPTAKIRVGVGMVNSFVPTIDGTSLAAFPPPALTVTGASGLIQLKATVDGLGNITALIVENVAGPSVTTDTATNKYKLIGTWTASGGVFTSVNSILNTNQTFRVCNGTAEWY